MARSGLEVADIFRDHGSAWRDANRGHISLGQLKVMRAIERCRTAALGGHVARCENEGCAYTVTSYNSCIMGKSSNREFGARFGLSLVDSRRFQRLSLPINRPLQRDHALGPRRQRMTTRRPELKFLAVLFRRQHAGNESLRLSIASLLSSGVLRNGELGWRRLVRQCDPVTANSPLLDCP